MRLPQQVARIQLLSITTASQNLYYHNLESGAKADLGIKHKYSSVGCRPLEAVPIRFFIKFIEDAYYEGTLH